MDDITWAGRRVGGCLTNSQGTLAGFDFVNGDVLHFLGQSRSWAALMPFMATAMPSGLTHVRAFHHILADDGDQVFSFQEAVWFCNRFKAI